MCGGNGSSKYYVYILESSLYGDYYKGFTTDFVSRIKAHNNGESQFTRGKGPWKLVFLREFVSRKEALQEEKRLKKCNKEYLQWLLQQTINLVVLK